MEGGSKARRWQLARGAGGGLSVRQFEASRSSVGDTLGLPAGVRRMKAAGPNLRRRLPSRHRSLRASQTNLYRHNPEVAAANFAETKSFMRLSFRGCVA